MRHLRRLAVHKWAPRGLAELRPPRSGKGKPTWWLHESVHPALAFNLDRDTRAAGATAALLASHPAHHVERARRKLHWLNHWLHRWRQHTSPLDKGGLRGVVPLTERQAAAAIVAEAKRVEGPDFKISVRSLQAWRRAYNEFDPATGQIRGLFALVPGYSPSPSTRGVACSSAAPAEACSSAAPAELGTATRSPAAIDYFYTLYHTLGGPTIKTCHHATSREAVRTHWLWPADYSATARWLDTYDDRSLTYLLREGSGSWSHKYLPHLEMDWTAVQPGEFFVCDHAQCDFWVGYKGTRLRPWFTAIQDCRSRMIVGWHLGPAPHQDAILSALRGAFRDYAIPRVMRIDNGKDFTSAPIVGLTKSELRALRGQYPKTWKRIIRRDRALVSCADPRWFGVAGELGIELIFAIPYSPWSKMIERFFGTMHTQFDRTILTYCGSTPVTRPECLPDILRGYTTAQLRRLKKAHGTDWRRHAAALQLLNTTRDIPTMEQARVALGEYLLLYHAASHRGHGMDGKSPSTVWSTATTLRRALDDELAFLMSIRGAYQVSANGVRLTLGGASLSYGAKSAALRRFVGREVLIALDTNDLSQCWAYTPERSSRRLIGRLAANARIHPCSTGQEVREAIAESQRAKSVMHKAARSAAQRSRTAAEALAKHRQHELAELRATGTDDASAAPAIAVVRTGFEGVSRPVQTAFNDYAPPPIEPDDFDDLFVPDDGPDGDVTAVASDSGLEDFFAADDAGTDTGAAYEDFL